VQWNAEIEAFKSQSEVWLRSESKEDALRSLVPNELLELESSRVRACR
jgi:hypothetical protein